MKCSRHCRRHFTEFNVSAFQCVRPLGKVRATPVVLRGGIILCSDRFDDLSVQIAIVGTALISEQVLVF